MSDVIVDIRSRIKREERVNYPNGTVIRFRMQHEDGGKKYKYAALFVSKRWFTTTVSLNSPVKKIMTSEQFFRVLGDPGVSKIELATTFEEI